jgi:DNA-binding GntR family transcriptional regulator
VASSLVPRAKARRVQAKKHAPLTMSERVSMTLAEAIIMGHFVPGERLDERELAEKFKVSRTPIREAFRELNARGLVDIRRRRGVVVADMGIERLAHLLEANCELEALCARRAADSMTVIERKELELIHIESEQYVATGQHIEYLAVNARFHRLFRGGIHNPVLSDILRTLQDHLTPFRQAQGDVDNRLELSHMEHEAIVTAVLASDPEAAYVAMRNHNARLSLHVLQLLKSRMPLSRVLSA